MNIDNKKNQSKSSFEDLRSAIASIALIRSENGHAIVRSEQTGARDPWIFDFRALMLQPQWIDRYAEIFWDMYGGKLPFQVGAMETAGIPLVTAIIMKGVERGTPVSGFFIRKSRKRQGLMKIVEGTLTDEKIILVDDLINSGQTLNKQVDILSELGKKVSDVFTMLSFRDDSAYVFFLEKHIELKHLFALADFGLPLVSPVAPEVPKNAFEEIWRYRAPNASNHLVVQKSAPATDGERIYLGYDDGTFRALDLQTGAVVWEFSVGRHPAGKGILSSPVLLDGIVYFGAYDGNFYALEARTGKKRWEYQDADWIGSSPSAAPETGVIYCGLEFGLFLKSGGICALDAKTGALLWTARHRGMTHGSPLYIPRESLVVIGSNDGILYAYDAKSGKLRWKFTSRGDIKTRPAYDEKRRSVIFGSMDGVVYAVSAANGEPIFARETGAGIYSIPLVYKNTVYVGSLDKCLYALDCETGKDRWIYETNGRIFSSPAINGTSLWIGSNDGRLYEIDPDSGKLRNFFQTTERIVNAVAFSKERIFVPTCANELYCIERSAEKKTSI